MPPQASCSASATFCTHCPTAPRAICSCAITVDLWVLAWAPQLGASRRQEHLPWRRDSPRRRRGRGTRGRGIDLFLTHPGSAGGGCNSAGSPSTRRLEQILFHARSPPMPSYAPEQMEDLHWVPSPSRWRQHRPARSGSVPSASTPKAPFEKVRRRRGARSSISAHVQIDTINVIERSHHHILLGRIPGYSRTDLEVGAINPTSRCSSTGRTRSPTCRRPITASSSRR